MDEDQFVAYMNSVDDMKQTSEICMLSLWIGIQIVDEIINQIEKKSLQPTTENSNKYKRYGLNIKYGSIEWIPLICLMLIILKNLIELIVLLCKQTTNTKGMFTIE